MRNTFIVAILIAFFGLIAAAQADTILYQDTFTATTGGALSSHALDVTSGEYGATSGAGWSANSNWKVNSSSDRAYVSYSSSTTADAWLPLTPQANCVYTLSADLYLEEYESGYYLGLGFAYGSSGIPSTTAKLYSASKAWIAENNTEDAVNLTYNVGTYAKTTTIGSWTGTGTEWNALSLSPFTPFSIVLTTTPGAWSASFYVNGSLQRTVNFASDPIITAVGFSQTGKYSNLDNFSLTVREVPEPATFALLAAGMAGLAVFAWRKRK